MDGLESEALRKKKKNRHSVVGTSTTEKVGIAEFAGKSSKNSSRAPLARLLPTVITIFAFCFGMTSIRLAMAHKWEYAVLCIFMSALLDSFDGRVARMLGHASQFGAELDSLSDLVCFGVAPSLMLFLYIKSAPNPYMENASWGICMFFTVCCALRLARFNAIQILNEPKPEWQKKYFTGVPAPAGAIVALFPFILFFSTNKVCFMNCKFIFFCLIASGVLMISTVKSFSSKMIELKNGIAFPELLIISLVVICLIIELWLTLTMLVIAYVAAIPYGIYQYARTEKEMKAHGDANQQVH
ncbi:MAG: CDP-diacylglycerol--serine O-phosphatidyltransferase [Holosporaceae bacterium]|jgi:CDP-diacylglycerol--serine O-phosphatidyltransferase|nr:CDP-diacylglycerol--serine O-phosphatidyltransferase [Holosporaceae bacterium]